MTKKQETLEMIFQSLTADIRLALEKTVVNNKLDRRTISDIRLRVGGASFVTADGASYKIDTQITKKTMEDIVFSLSDGSVYAHADTLRRGYIDRGGVRIGVVGRAVTDGDCVREINSPTSVTFRIPHRIVGCSRPIYELFRSDDLKKGILIYSPPAVGKTTLLCDLIRELSLASVQFAVIDSRGELSAFGEDPSADILLHYPKPSGIEIAVRTLSPELIICDELSGEDDAKAALYAFSCGVPIIASSHAENFSDLSKRREFRELFELGVFGAAVGLIRKYGSCEFSFDIKRI